MRTSFLLCLSCPHRCRFLFALPLRRIQYESLLLLQQNCGFLPEILLSLDGFVRDFAYQCPRGDPVSSKPTRSFVLMTDSRTCNEHRIPSVVNIPLVYKSQGWGISAPLLARLSNGKHLAQKVLVMHISAVICLEQLSRETSGTSNPSKYPCLDY